MLHWQRSSKVYSLMLYHNQQIFLLHNDDLRFCDKLTHTIQNITEKWTYLPHRSVPQRLQGKVRKCLAMWLRQSIIRPSKSPFASWVVNVWKKTSEIWLCENYWKLNSSVTRDAFPLPQIHREVQAVNNCQWFMLFDVAQYYLQLPVEEADIKMMAFWARLPGLYEFMCIPLWFIQLRV